MLRDDNASGLDSSGIESAVQNEIEEINTALTKFLTRGKPVLFDENIFSSGTRSLVKNLNRLFSHYGELKNFSIDLAEGNLSDNLIQRDNWLAGPLKSLHAQMLHLSWQTKQVANGDYNQIVDFMGEFSEAFNRMILQLNERETQLAQGQNALRTVLESTPNGVIVIDCHTRNILFKNETAQLLLAANHLVEQDDYLSIEQTLANFNESGGDAVAWELSCVNSALRLSVYSNRISWLNESAYLHIIRDVTEEKQTADDLRSFAYYDHSTGVGNRNSGLEYLSAQINSPANNLSSSNFKKILAVKMAQQNRGSTNL